MPRRLDKTEHERRRQTVLTSASIAEAADILHISYDQMRQWTLRNMPEEYATKAQKATGSALPNARSRILRRRHKESIDTTPRIPHTDTEFAESFVGLVNQLKREVEELKARNLELETRNQNLEVRLGEAEAKETADREEVYRQIYEGGARSLSR